MFIYSDFFDRGNRFLYKAAFRGLKYGLGQKLYILSKKFIQPIQDTAGKHFPVCERLPGFVLMGFNPILCTKYTIPARGHITVD